jgi:hypothetical protein
LFAGVGTTPALEIYFYPPLKIIFYSVTTHLFILNCQVQQFGGVANNYRKTIWNAGKLANVAVQHVKVK